MYGAQAIEKKIVDLDEFENDVEMYGAQAFPRTINLDLLFENDVEMYGAQASVYSTFSK